MAQINVSLPDGLKTWADSRVSEGDYSSTSDYVRDLIRRDRAREARMAREAGEWLRAEIEHGLASGVSERSLKDIYEENRSRREAA